jgi:hypothetical protein
VAFLRTLVDRMAGCEQTAILPGMALRWRDVANVTVPVLVVVPLDKARRPLPGSIQIGEAFDRDAGRYLAVRNSVSAKALSSLTRGRERDSHVSGFGAIFAALYVVSSYKRRCR